MDVLDVFVAAPKLAREDLMKEVVHNTVIGVVDNPTLQKKNFFYI